MTSATRITGLTNGTSYDVRVRACNTDGDYCGDWSEAASGIPQPPPTVNDSNPLVGQSVTLTAPSMSTQTASSYQWQHWSGDAWANQGVTSTSSTLTAASPGSAGIMAYRVTVTFGTGATAYRPACRLPFCCYRLMIG